MRVLVLGGTGAMGVHLVSLLSNSGIDSTITSRSYRKSKNHVKYIQGDAQDLIFLKTILSENWDIIVDFMVYSTADFEDRVEFLLKATNQYIFISTARVYADSEELLKETSTRLLDVLKDKQFLSTDEYSLTKARQEDILKNSGFLNWTIIRPYITYSEVRFQLGVMEKEDWLYRALKGRKIVFSKDIISKLTTLTYGLDVSKAIFAVLGNYKTFGEIFHVTSDKAYSWNDVLDIYLNNLENHLGFRPKVVLQEIDGFFKHHPAKYQMLYDRMYDRQFDNTKISGYIEIAEFITLEEGIKKSLEEFFKKPSFKKINWRNEALKDRFSKDTSSLSEIKSFKDKIKYIVFRYLKK